MGIRSVWILRFLSLVRPRLSQHSGRKHRNRQDGFVPARETLLESKVTECRPNETARLGTDQNLQGEIRQVSNPRASSIGEGE